MSFTDITYTTTEFEDLTNTLTNIDDVEILTIDKLSDSSSNIRGIELETEDLEILETEDLEVLYIEGTYPMTDSIYTITEFIDL